MTESENSSFLDGKYNNKYRIVSTRLPQWDYGSVAAYFVTICTVNRQCFLGDIEIRRDAMHRVSTANRVFTIQLSQIGEIVASEWMETPGMRQDMNLELGEFVVMPNHFHGIIIIGENRYNCRDAMHRVSTYGPQSKNLASVIRGFKSSVTIQSRRIKPDFAWQSRYYEHIIRDEKSYREISEYILNNPSNWQKDKYYIG